MKYLLDTNICIYIIKNKSTDVLNHFSRCVPGEILISSITLAELRYGVEKSQHREKNNLALNQFIIPLEVIPFDEQATHFYGKLRTTLESKGIPIGPLDLMIASHAQSLNLTLVTNNLREFSRVPKLKLENWARTG